MSSISLIVRGEEFGLCHAANQAIAEAFETGILTCASLVVTTPWLAEAQALAHEHPEWELGLQLTLHSPTGGYRWGPVSGAAQVPSLVESSGVFAPQLSPAARSEDVSREVDAQVERALACGLRPAYLEFDGADHPAVEAALQQWSTRLGAPARMATWGIHALALPEPSERALHDTLSALKPGVYLWLTHPAHDAPETWALWEGPEMASARYAESLALCSPEVRALLDQRGVERISFRQYVEQRLGADTDE